MSPSFRRHRAVDRDGDLLRRRRPHLDPWRDLRRADGQLGTHHVLRGSCRRCGCSRWARCSFWWWCAFPNGLAGILSQLPRSAGRSGAAARPPPRRRPSRRSRRPHASVAANSRSSHAIGNRLSAQRRGTDRLVRRLSRGGRPVTSISIATRSASSSVRTARARPRAGSDLWPHQGDQRSIKFKGLELTQMKEHEIVRAGVGRKFQTPSIYEDLTVFENLEISFPRGRSVFGALGVSPRCRGAGPGRGNRAEHFPCRPSGSISPNTQPRTEAMAGDRHVADPGSGLDDAGRAGGRHERQRTQEDRRTAAPGDPAPLRAGDRARHGFRRATSPTR